MRRLVVIGASLAGLRAAQAIRSHGFDGELIIVGEEARMPYTRPPLSKEMLAGEQPAERCDFDCSALQATWRLGETATGLDVHAHTVTLASGDRIDFDRLVLATGCRARDWPGPGAGLTGLHTLRSLDDALALQAAFTTARRVAVVGAGFIGCEVAATARKLGLEVTLIDIAPRPLAPFGPLLGERCAELHAVHGVALRLGCGIAAFEGEQRLEAVTLSDGARIDADLAVVALGAAPNTEWLDGAGLTLYRGGVVCDATLTATSAPDVLCAGDIAAWPHPLADGAVVRIEHWTNAAEQGAAAGRNALQNPGDRGAYAAVPYVWSDQYDVKLQAVGFPALATEMRELEREDGRFVAVGARDGRAVAAIAWNAARRLVVYRRALQRRPSLVDLTAQIDADPKALRRDSEVPA